MVLPAVTVILIIFSQQPCSVNAASRRFMHYAAIFTEAYCMKFEGPCQSFPDEHLELGASAVYANNQPAENGADDPNRNDNAGAVVRRWGSANPRIRVLLLDLTPACLPVRGW